MQNSGRRWRYTLVLGLPAVLGMAAWLVAGALVAPAMREVGPAPDDLPVHATRLKSQSGSSIATWHIPAAGSTATVLLVHSLRGDRRSMLPRARWLHETGYDVVLMDLQAHGESPGECITLGHLERHDVRAAVDYARRANPSHRIGVIGNSLGGVAAVLASPLGVDALVLEAVYPTIDEAVHDRVCARVGPLHFLAAPLLLCQLRPRLGFSRAELRPIERIADAGCPVLLAVGDADQHTTLAETQRMLAAAREPKQLLVFAGAAHEDLYAHDGGLYAREIGEFLERHLRSAGPPVPR